MSDRSRRLATVVSMLLLLTLPPPTAHAAEPGEWEPSNEIRWTADMSPLVLSESMEIDATTRLFVERGVEVRLDQGVGILVEGELHVEGTEEEPVIFTSNLSGPVSPNHWEGVRLLPGPEERLHEVEWATFEGADTGLLVSSTYAVVSACTFFMNRYGLHARGEAVLDVYSSEFLDNSVLGLEFEGGAEGGVVGCTFDDNVVGIYCFDGSAPYIEDCTFEGNYHHLSFARGSNATVHTCELRDAVAEAYECYDQSAPLFEGVTFAGGGDDMIHIRNASRPRMVSGTPVSTLKVDSKDNASYVVAMARITVVVEKEGGKRLVDANVTLRGASGSVFTTGTTDAEGRLPGALMSMYTVNAQGGHDRENPHSVQVEWRGHDQTFYVDPRDLDNDRVLLLEMDLEPPEPDEGWGILPIALVAFVIVAAVAMVAWYVQRRR